MHFFTLKGLPPAPVCSAARKATAFQHELAAAEDAAILATLDPRDNEVLTPASDEHAAFAAAVQPVLAKYRKELDPKLFGYLEG